MSGFSRYDELLDRLGKHKTGKSCLYVNRLSDVDMEVLEELVRSSVSTSGIDNTALLRRHAYFAIPPDSSLLRNRTG